MSIANWTDKNYAQAAIDMLPDDPYAIGPFLARQEVQARGRRDACECPINQWVSKWIDGQCITNALAVHKVDDENGWFVSIPEPVSRFIARFDTGMISF